MVVWIRSLVGLERPGHKNSGPTLVEDQYEAGKRPGTIVVFV
jgi:hypothetical protein